MNIPSPETFAAWRRGIISDEHLAELEAFYAAMLAGSAALGDGFMLMAREMRRECEALDRIRRARK